MTSIPSSGTEMRQGAPRTGKSYRLHLPPNIPVDVFFGTKAPAGKEHNRVRTLPGTGWNTILRLCGPREPWFATKWRPGEIELIP